MLVSDQVYYLDRVGGCVEGIHAAAVRIQTQILQDPVWSIVKRHMLSLSHIYALFRYTASQLRVPLCDDARGHILRRRCVWVSATLWQTSDMCATFYTTNQELRLLWRSWSVQLRKFALTVSTDSNFSSGIETQNCSV